MDELLKYVNRANTNCIKWDGLMDTFHMEGLLPMWVADMDFKAPDCVIRALEDYLAMGAFGYYKIPDSYYDAFISWEKNRHGIEVRREWLRFSPGVVSALCWTVNILTRPGDGIMVFTPVYYPFFSSVQDNGRRLIRCPLTNRDGIYSIDFDLFRSMAKEQSARALILSSPHNPVGRVWTEQELSCILEICRELDIKVIADEIHQDFTFAHRQTPCLSVGDYGDMLISITAPSKTFNLAACQNSILIIQDAKLREAYDAFTTPLQVRDGNSFGYIAAEAAYRGGGPWLDQLLDVIRSNYQYISSALGKHLPLARVSPLEGTYLMWIDLSGYGLDGNNLPQAMARCGLAPDFGGWFGEESGGFIRLNLATSPENIRLAAELLINGLGK